MKNVYLSPSGTKRGLMWIFFILFWPRDTKLDETIPPQEYSLELLVSLNYENTVEHVLVRARKIHELVFINHSSFFSSSLPKMKMVSSFLSWTR